MRNNYALFFPSLIILFLLAGLIPDGLVSDTAAASARDDYQKIQRDIRKQKKKLAVATKTEKSVINDLRRVDTQISDIGDQISTTKKQIKDIRGNISVLEGQITANMNSLETEREYLRKRLRFSTEVLIRCTVSASFSS